MGCCGPRCCGIAASIGVVIGLVFATSLSPIISTIIDQQLALRPGTIMYSFWEKSPVPMYIRFYLFNVTNSDEVANNKAVPVLEEYGPYTFTETHYRVNLERYDNYTLKFQQKRVWHFVEEMSNGSLSDTITTLNVPLMSAAYTIRFYPKYTIKLPFNKVIREFGSEMFVTKTVGQLLFDGYTDPLLDLASILPPGVINIPPYDKFGWFYLRNNSETFDGTFNVFTGEDDISKLDVLDMWNNQTQTKYYDSYCGRVNGSFGEGWPPRREKTEISLYSTDLCRSVSLDYTEDVTQSGVTFYKFAGTERLFANETENPDNGCFCSGGVCNPSGIVNSSTCRYGSPAFVSFPHFYLAPDYEKQVVGLAPNQEEHEFRVVLEPRTSVPLEVRARFQINILMEPIDDIPITQNVTRTFLPVLWFGVSADLSDNLLGWIHFTLVSPLIGTASFYALFAFCLISAVVCRIIYIRRRKGSTV